MTRSQLDTLWCLIDNQLDGTDPKDSEWICEQWLAEIEGWA